jgi:7-keto-8-aminopelargonate synthetase-like enzyme
MGTFSKSLASLGGYMASSEVVAEYVRHNSRPFIFSASMTPASCACALAALRVLEKEPERVERLQSLCRYTNDGLAKRNIPHKYTADIPIIPIYTYDATRTLIIAKKLYQAGVYVNPVLPPATPATECLLRTSYMATLSEPLLDEAMDIMADVLKEDTL